MRENSRNSVRRPRCASQRPNDRRLRQCEAHHGRLSNATGRLRGQPHGAARLPLVGDDADIKPVDSSAALRTSLKPILASSAMMRSMVTPAWAAGAREGGIAGDDEELRKFRQGGDDVFRDAVGEIFLLRIAAHVGEWQHGDRHARRVRRRGGGEREQRAFRGGFERIDPHLGWTLAVVTCELPNARSGRPRATRRVRAAKKTKVVHAVTSSQGRAYETQTSPSSESSICTILMVNPRSSGECRKGTPNDRIQDRGWRLRRS